MITETDIAIFTSLTGFDLQGYFQRAIDFVDDDYPNIFGYYSGRLDELDSGAIERLNSLLADYKTLSSLYATFADKLSNYKWWDLLEQIENVQSSMLTVQNLSKWLRSARLNGSYQSNALVDVTLPQNETLESLNRNVFGVEDWNDEWVDTAINSNLIEEDYTSEGGVGLKAKLVTSGQLQINSIVDNLIGDSILGLDIQKKLTIEDNDLVVLDYRETFKQAVEILSSLKKGDNPTFPDQGINPRFVAGANINLVNYPIIFRQMTSVFATDDSIKSFTLVDIRRDSDAVYLEFEVESRRSDLQQITVSLEN